MSSFTASLDFDHIGYGVYRTRHGFRFYLLDSKTGDYVDVPAGFYSNGASIPVLLRCLFGWQAMNFYWAQAAFLHDGLVAESNVQLYICNDASGTKRVPTWSEAATWFDAALCVKQAHAPACPPVNRRLFVFAVRLYGLVRRTKNRSHP
jgi:hypothetical protein